MSVEQSLNQETYDTYRPWLNADELILVSQLDSKFKHTFDLRNKLQEQQALTNYMQTAPDQYNLNMPESGLDMQSVPGLDKVMSQGSGLYMGQMQGGFAFGALLPILGTIAGPLIGMAVDGIKALIDRKRAAKLAAQGQGAISAPNGGALVEDWFRQNQPQLQSIENHLGSLRGKQFWSELVALIKSSVRDIVPKVAQVSPAVASHVTQLVVDKIIPASFQRMKSDKAASGSGKMRRDKGGFSFMSIVKPVARWALGKIIKSSSAANNIYKKIKDTGAFLDSAAEKQGMKYGSGIGGSWLGNIANVAKSVLLKTLPAVSNVTQHVAAPMLDKVLSKFKASDFVSDTVRDFGKVAIEGATSGVADILRRSQQPKQPQQLAPVAPVAPVAPITHADTYASNPWDSGAHRGSLDPLVYSDPRNWSYVGEQTSYVNPARLYEQQQVASMQQLRQPPKPQMVETAPTTKPKKKRYGMGAQKKKVTRGGATKVPLKFNIKML